ncbi:NAD-dependent dehydratase [Candidatus Aerophobetes bacterium Ae_b3b]|nr:MAG: NAD-dependent dehydratase [Candidatus Aerophobetes bacterium Ae_b3b]
MLESKRVLVTGAGGFIGSHLTERLVDLGAQVTAFLRYNSRADEAMIGLLPPEKKKKIRIIYGELRQSETVKRAMKNIDIVFNLAALISIPYSYLHPQEVIETNTLGTLNVLTAAREEEVEKLVQTSTSEVYGTAQYIPIDEKHPKQPQSPYSASKIAADAIALSFYYSFNLPVAIIRPFNAYGPRQSDRAVIPAIISQALVKKKVLIGSTTPTRDLNFVSDTVEGFIKIAESENSIGEEINIGSGFEISIGDLAEKIVSLVGKEVKLIKDEKRVRPEKSEVERLLADNSKARKLLGWSPRVSLDAGLKMTIKWIKDHPDFYKPGTYKV